MENSNDTCLLTQINFMENLVNDIYLLLSIIPKQENNYRRQSLLLVYDAIKRNYKKRLFTDVEKDFLSEIVNHSKNNYVSAEEYFQQDKWLYEHGIDIFPCLDIENENLE